MGIFSSSGDFGDHVRKRVNAYNFWCLMYVSIGSVCYGYTANVISATLAQPSFLSYWNFDTRPGGASLLATTNGLFQTGGVLGTLTLPVFCDRWGRKAGLAFSAFLCMFSGAFLAGSTNIGEFLLFRFIAGAGAFMCLAAVPIWMAEVVPPYLRGALVQIHAISLVVGYMAASWLGYGVYFYKSTITWRIPFAVQCVWPLCLLAGVYWVPESPRWLILNGKAEKAKEVLLRLHDDPKDPHHTFARAEYIQIRKQCEIDKTLPSSYWYIWTNKSHRKRALLSIGTTGIIQCSGVLIINNYGPFIYKTLGFDTPTQLIYGAAWLTFALGMNSVALFLNDRFPRNKFLALGVLGCMADLAIVAGLTATYYGTNNTAGLKAIVAFYFIFEIPYDWCLDGMQFTYITELWPLHLRAKGMSMAVSMTSLMNIIWLQSAPIAIDNIGWKFWLALICPGTIGSVVIWFFWPNTKGMPLEEVAGIFGDRDEVAGYMRDINVSDDDVTGLGFENHGGVQSDRKGKVTHEENGDHHSDQSKDIEDKV